MLEACEMLGISEPTLRRMAARKAIKVIRLSGIGGRGRTLVPASEIERLTTGK